MCPQNRISDDITDLQVDCQCDENPIMAKTLQDRLKEAYAESPYKSYAALARAAGLKSPSTVSDLMRGELGEDASALVPIAHVLKVSAMWLTRGRGPKEVLSLRLAEAPEFDSELLRRTVSAQRLMGEHLKELLGAYLRATEAGRVTLMSAARRCDKVDLSALIVPIDDTAAD